MEKNTKLRIGQIAIAVAIIALMAVAFYFAKDWWEKSWLIAVALLEAFVVCMESGIGCKGQKA